MAENLLEKLTRSQYIRWAAWAEALSALQEDPETHEYEIPGPVKEKWSSLFTIPFENLSDQQKNNLRHLAQERLDIFLK